MYGEEELQVIEKVREAWGILSAALPGINPRWVVLIAASKYLTILDQPRYFSQLTSLDTDDASTVLCGTQPRGGTTWAWIAHNCLYGEVGASFLKENADLASVQAWRPFQLDPGDISRFDANVPRDAALFTAYRSARAWERRSDDLRLADTLPAPLRVTALDAVVSAITADFSQESAAMLNLHLRYSPTMPDLSHASYAWGGPTA